MYAQKIKEMINLANILLEMLSDYDYKNNDFRLDFKTKYHELERFIPSHNNCYELFVNSFLHCDKDEKSFVRECVVYDIIYHKLEVLKLKLELENLKK